LENEGHEMTRSTITLASFAACAALVIAACGDDGRGPTDSGTSGDTGSSSDTGTVVDSGTSGDGGENLGARCGYDAPCVRAAADIFCTSAPGTMQYQCCLPAEPDPSAGCTEASGGSNEDVMTYCCTGEP
jgi:hypothetical protein